MKLTGYIKDSPVKQFNKPSWLRKRIAASDNLEETVSLLKELNINTVCESAICPNAGECFSRKTVTFIILGNQCTRNCRFCAVLKNTPEPVDPAEPQKITLASAKLGLKHVVITSVTRDDLPDGGAQQFVATIHALKEQLPGVMVEVLTPDFQGDRRAIHDVVDAGPHIFCHNMETVSRLYQQVRPDADYHRSLEVLRVAKERSPLLYTKSGIMLGLGESRDEVINVMTDLRNAGCDFITIGQYLQPSPHHLSVDEYVSPEAFYYYAEEGRRQGFLYVSSSPFARSSYYPTPLNI